MKQAPPEQLSLADLFGKIKEDPTPVKPERRIKNFVLSPNDIERVERCEASRVFVGPKEELHAGQWYGIFVHRFLEQCITKGRSAALAYVRSKRNKGVINVCERLKTDSLPEHGIPELTIAIDPTAGTAEAIDFDMAEAELHIVGRSDLVFQNLTRENRWHVWDFKTGNKDRVIKPEGNVQLLTNAVGLQLLQDAEDVKGSIVTIDSQSGDLCEASTLYKPKELKRHLHRLKMAHYMTMETRAELVEEGIEPSIAPAPERCFQCRAKTVCHGAAILR